VQLGRLAKALSSYLYEYWWIRAPGMDRREQPITGAQATGRRSMNGWRSKRPRPLTLMHSIPPAALASGLN